MCALDGKMLPDIKQRAYTSNSLWASAYQEKQIHNQDAEKKCFA